MSGRPVRKILIVTLSNLGDVVLTLPVFEALCRKYPGATIDAVVGESSKVIFEGHPKISGIFVYSRRIPFREKLAFVRKIRQTRYDIAIDLRRSLIGLLARASRRNSYLDHSKKSMHRARRHFRSLRSFGITEMPDTSFLKTGLINDFQGFPVSGDDGKPVIVAACGSKSDIKKWPGASYAALLDRLIDEQSARVILIGDQNEAALGSEVLAAMNRKDRAINLCGKTNFRELLSVIQKASLVVTNDSSPLHIADSLHVPVLGIFGPTSPSKYGPIGKRGLSAKRTLFCSPCEAPQCRYAHECMKDLSVDEVYKKAKALLDDRQAAAKPRLLLIRLDRVGDAVLSMPALQAVRDAFPKAHITVMARGYTRELFERHPAVDSVLVYDYEKNGRHSGIAGNKRFIYEVIKGRYDAALALNPSVRSHLVPFCAGIPYRVGFDSKVPFALTIKVKDLRYQGLKHESEYTLDIVRAFKVNPASKNLPSLVLYEADHRNARELLKEKDSGTKGKVLAIHAGASCPSKRWPKERFAELAQKASKELGCRIAIIGGEDEKELGRYIAAEVGNAAVDLTGRLKLSELAAVLKQSACLVTNDSGPVHVASAVSTPTVCIFGRTRMGLNAARWRALGPNNRVVQKDVGCVVCLAHDCTIDFECLKAVDTELVLKNVKELWG